MPDEEPPSQPRAGRDRRGPDSSFGSSDTKRRREEARSARHTNSFSSLENSNEDRRDSI